MKRSLHNILTSWYQWARRVYASVPSNVRRWLLSSLGTILIGLSFYYVGRNLLPALAEIRWSGLQATSGWLLAAFGVALLGTALVGIIWYLFVYSVGYRISPYTALWLQLSSNMIKYLPGGPWQLAGKALLTRRRGVPTDVVSFLVMVEAGVCVATGTLIALLSAPESLPQLGLVLPAAARLALAAIIVATLIVFPDLTHKWTAWATARAWRWGKFQVRRRQFYLACLLMVVQWLLVIAMVALAVRVWPGPTAINWWQTAFAVTVSSVLGLVVLVAPAGIGIREAALTFTLGIWMAPEGAVVIGVLSRVLFVLSELTLYGLARIARRIRRSGRTSDPVLPLR